MEVVAVSPVNPLAESPFNDQPKTITGTTAGFSFNLSLSAISQSIKQIQVLFYTLEKLLSSSVKEGDVASEDALTCIKSAKKLFSGNAESSRKLLSSAYRHCGDVMLACQMSAEDRRMLLEGSLESAKVLNRQFSQYKREFGNALSEFELQKPRLLVPKLHQSELDITPEPTHSIERAVNNLFSSLHSIQTYLSEIIAFWDDHAELLSDDINLSPSSNNNRSSSADHHNLPETWLLYQRALLDASSSIAESVDAMAVEPAVHPRPRLHRVPRAAQEEGGMLHALQWFWRIITFTHYRVR